MTLDLLAPADAPALDDTMTALADATRRAILRRLAQGEARVTELAAPFAISLNSVSKHIRILERARLVHRRVVGREHLLSFDPAPLAEASAWIHEQQVFWSRRLDALEAALQADDAAAAAAARPAPAPARKARRPARKGSAR